MKTNIYFFLLLGFTVLVSCEPELDDKIDLGPTPSASFEIIAGDTPNDFILRNTTEGAFMTQWNVENFGSYEGQEVLVSIPLKGDYEIQMTTFNSGGSSSASQSVSVSQDDPDNCFGNQELLTACDTKIWKIAFEEGALNVGNGSTEIWWANSQSDLTERSCLFDDEYIFSSDGTFEFNNKGDFWADTDGNDVVWPSDLGLDPGCHQAASWPDKYSAWSSGMHTFTITNERITVIGEGAHLGLYKIGTSGEVTQPQTSVSLEIKEMTETRMVLIADYSGVVWTLIFVSE